MELHWELMLESVNPLLKGTLITLELTAGAVAMGIVIGLFMALMRLSNSRILRGFAIAYIDFFRGTPLLVQILMVYFAVPQLLNFQIPDNYQFIAGISAMGLNSGAYIAEIFRAGIQSIDKGQGEAARSLGMTQGQAMRHVILPQAFKRVIPPLGNEFIALLKDSSLVSFIALQDLMYSGKLIVSRTYQPFVIYLEVALFYLAMTLILSRFVNYTERRFGKSDNR
ncbi:amino acid ABC transporter membrane protein (PAAT family) [Desulfitobacterium sp. LBE]|uniref:Polar amino acid ABC transporter, inner membrane subunit n=3 Tax=root TaxID=1 RepID=B8FYZ4_DESHD|nr:MULTISPECIES: amino acid ABC transporter permease [Desulfitobacterium]ACL22746.1 polar amino acid ABC transporter, inner membrane subunit [Desulfitobacterium hafniense DCB-2]MEA5022019.1 amino acid ABC transporter permease [Desulfitobacterium hafniense]TWH59229.1 amino acid ABC transporter membrane protein (PAAT family) [Desulfitobacterium sp. LBE]